MHTKIQHKLLKAYQSWFAYDDDLITHSGLIILILLCSMHKTNERLCSNFEWDQPDHRLIDQHRIQYRNRIHQWTVG